MITLSSIKRAAQELYAKHNTYLNSLGKFLLATLSFLLINQRLGHMELLNNIFVILIGALFCSFLSSNAIILLGAGLILGHLYSLSLAALLGGGGILIILLLVYFGLGAKESYAIIFTMLALVMEIPCVVPIILGLVATPLSMIPLCFGTIAFYTLQYIGRRQNTGTGSDILALVGDVQRYLRGVFKEPEMVLMIISLVAVLMVVFVVRRMAIKYAWRVAVVTGVVTYLIIYVVGSVMLGIEDGLLWGVIGSILALVSGFITEFFLFQVDYKKTMSVQFEDEEYHYYVKAIPKLKKGSE